MQTASIACCYHCGLPNASTTIQFDDKLFCCEGCKSVYQILANHQLCTYYTLSNHPGVNQQNRIPSYYDFLDREEMINQYVLFRSGSEMQVSFQINSMHCISCIWLLEHLAKLHSGVLSSRVQFLQRKADILFDSAKISLKELVMLLKKLGYEPTLSVEETKKVSDKTHNRTQLIKIAIAGFCFGNSMMVSLPDYFASGNFFTDSTLQQLFNIISLILALPVFFYCAQEFYVSSWQHVKHRRITLDLPITLAILVTFGFSCYKIIWQQQLGYIDSMSGIVFFMLVGRYFQHQTYNALQFQTSISSYLPLSVNKLLEQVEVNIPLAEIQVGDELIIRYGEVIPTDCVQMHESGWFDYSLVTGESKAIEKMPNEIIYAGAIQKSGKCIVKVSKKASDSYITQLWSTSNAKKFEDENSSYTEKVNLYFSSAVLSIGILACAFWLFQGESKTSFKALLSIWIVACPCALLLSSTFTYGGMLKIFALNGMYIKNAAVLEKMSEITSLVFDKTGTLTNTKQATLHYFGKPLDATQQGWISSICQTSQHPLSRLIVQYFSSPLNFRVRSLHTAEGKGLEGIIENVQIKIGSAAWMGISQSNPQSASNVYLKIEEDIVGYFAIQHPYREGVLASLPALEKNYHLHVVSGDNDAERKVLRPYFAQEKNILFNQLPEEKAKYIHQLQAKKEKVMMLGDGLNDSVALQDSDIGLALLQKQTNYLPNCDVLLQEDHVVCLPTLMRYTRQSKFILHTCFGVSIVYNVFGIAFAVQGLLSPVIAAILMPCSTLSIIGCSFFLSKYFAIRQGLQV
jgi:Cu+-exporting ATPase